MEIEHRPDVEPCEFCGKLGCDYDCDESQADGFSDYDLEKDNLLTELSEKLTELSGPSCGQCEPMMINGVFCHETGCPTESRIRQLKKQIENIENFS